MLLEVVFGIAILLILIVGLINRRKQNKTWLEEERREESGYWVDKRGGERGTYGSLDAEREAERFSLTRRGRISDLALEIRNYAFDHFPGFHNLSDDQIRAFTAFARQESEKLFVAAESVQRGQLPEFSREPEAYGEPVKALNAFLLKQLYAYFPPLLNQDLDLIRQFDACTGLIAKGLLEKSDAFFPNQR